MKNHLSTKLAKTCLFLFLCASFTACNKGDYYEKEYLNTPESTDAVDTGNDPTQGGVAGGFTGGSTAGSTTGSSTGGTTGSTTGGTTGSTTGGTTGGSTTGGTTGGTTGTTSASETFKQTERKKVDIVWIIDNSGSMADEQANLGYNFDAFINEFIDTQVDFKMAITTTDTSSSTLKGKMVYGSDVKLTSAKAQADEATFKSDFKNLVRVGTSGSGYEKGLAASEGFMQKYNTSFIRPDAYLAVVLLSDEEDQSQYLPADYMNYLKSFKANAGMVKFYSICDIGNTNVGQGITTGCARYKKASELTSGSVSDIRGDFYNSLNDLGTSLINLLDSFPLAATPAPNTAISVKVNGVTEPSANWTFDAASRSIRFNANHVPPMNATIVVTYQK